MLSLLIAMSAFSLTMSISPGPVNMVIASSGASHGVRRTLPFVSGATIGFSLLLICVGLSFLRVVDAYPGLLVGLELAGSAFIVYVGCRIAVSAPDAALEKRKVPTFVQGFALQWLNPKAWIACASGSALFTDPGSPARFATFVALYFLICYASLAAWALLGERMAVLLRNPLRIRLFNLAMGALLIASALHIVIGRLRG